MEYLLGSLITMATFLIVKKIYAVSVKDEPKIRLSYSQSHIFSMLRPFLGDLSKISKQKNTQAMAYDKRNNVRVILADRKAYWILDNTFYEADELDGSIDKESAKPVDIMAMDKVQLNKMIMIVEALTEGGDDEDWDSGK